MSPALIAAPPAGNAPTGPATPPTPPPPPAPLPAARSRTATGIYECPGCGERLAGQRRCPNCNRYARRVGTGDECPACGDAITITELLEAATT